MTLYAVRMIEDRQPVGIFSAPNVRHLWDMVDSVTDPCCCEYKKLKPCGFVWESRVSWKMGTEDGPLVGKDPETDSDFDDAIDQRRSHIFASMGLGHSFSSALGDLLDGTEETAGWKKCPHANEPGGLIYETMLRHSPLPK